MLYSILSQDHPAAKVRSVGQDLNPQAASLLAESYFHNNTTRKVWVMDEKGRVFEEKGKRSVWEKPANAPIVIPSEQLAAGDLESWLDVLDLSDPS